MILQLTTEIVGAFYIAYLISKFVFWLDTPSSRKGRRHA